MAQNGSYQSLQVCRMRVTRLDTLGAPATGANASFVSGALVSVGISPDFADGPELTAENGCGGICATFKGDDILRKINLSFELCNLDSELIEILTGQSVIVSGATTIGHMFPRAGACTTVAAHAVALEFWSKRWDGCDAPSGAEATLPYWRWVFPYARLRTGDMTLENGFLRVPITGFARENANFGAGPYGDLPIGSIPSAGAVFADSEPPAADVTYVAVP
jgi:hypothetical protein